MFVKQLSVFLENRQGRLEGFTSLLGENGIDLTAITVADTASFGILRAIVDDYEKAAAVLRENGFTVKVSDVMAVAVPDTPGGLAGVLRLLQQRDISVEYLYSLVRRVNHEAIAIVRVDKPAEAVAWLQKNGVRLLAQADMARQVP